jgi:hypothetical protein
VRSAALLVALAAALLPSGCLTQNLWETSVTAGSFGRPVPAPPGPVRAEAAVRTGDGSYHVLVAYSDGRTRRVIVAPLEAAPVGSDAWPAPERAWPDRPHVTTDLALPAGVPIRCQGRSDERVRREGEPDLALSVLVGDEPVTGHDDGEGVLLALEAGELRLLGPGDQARTLARLRPPTSSAPRPVAASRTVRLLIAVSTLLATPVALAFDLAALGATIGSLGVLAPLFFAPFA